MVPCHSPATSRPARPRLSACNWRGRDERAGAARCSRTSPALTPTRRSSTRCAAPTSARSPPPRSPPTVLRLLGRRAAPARGAPRASALHPPSHLPQARSAKKKPLSFTKRDDSNAPGGACGLGARQATGTPRPAGRRAQSRPPTRALPLFPRRARPTAAARCLRAVQRAPPRTRPPRLHWSDATHAHARRLSQM